MNGDDTRARLENAGLAEAVRGRVSVRRFSAEPVPREDLIAMVDLAIRAANAGNAQGWRFVAVEDEALRAAMKDAVDAALDEMAAWPEASGMEKEMKAYRAYATFFDRAPVVVAVFDEVYHSLPDELHRRRGLSAEEHDRLRQRPDLQSIGGAVQLLCTAAHALGYGTCWMTGPVLAAPAIETLLGVEPPARLAAIVPLGRPAGRPKASVRRPARDVLEFR